ncbi:winged helix-turn-helix transcriptional regulator [Fangia hongkongensis]|uniref:winged helix-turn-helix transcriptional regulator n=1 Tax=Fangia hongkongensis TaxID=270495 RepID=UPI00047773E2|nr:helix-turn-helix domain-containing protein [Fangia hongkongensis]MBK2125264.1 helix-turn-helix transcriptional regulator [Fangia hongkongensis]
MKHSKDIQPHCPMGATLAILSGKWKLLILTHLTTGKKRFSELQKCIPDITQRMLTMQLRELEALKIIHRKVFPVIPPKVEYTLTDIGFSLQPVLNHLESWGEHYLKEVLTVPDKV